MKETNGLSFPGLEGLRNPNTKDKRTCGHSPSNISHRLAFKTSGLLLIGASSHGSKIKYIYILVGTWMPNKACGQKEKPLFYTADRKGSGILPHPGPTAP